MVFKKFFKNKTQVLTKKQLRFVDLKFKEPFGNVCVNKNNSCSFFV